MDSKKTIHAVFEWEGLQSKKKIARLEHSGKLVSGSSTATIVRDDSYRLVPTEGENEALNSRHPQIHTHEADQEAEKLWRLSEDLRTLFHKIMLRLLGYAGEYLDYSKREVQKLNSEPLCLCGKK
jgi:hypothetical protein